jgi:hypothetical protein
MTSTEGDSGEGVPCIGTFLSLSLRPKRKSVELGRPVLTLRPEEMSRGERK